MKVLVKTTGSAALLVSLSLLCAGGVQARNEPFFFPIQDAFKTGEARSRFNGDIKFYFGDQPYPDVEATLSQGIVAYKKGTIYNAGEREEEEVKTCHKTFLVALAELQARARRVGGNAVINIESYYKDVSFRSNDQYECRVGNAKTGVMLRGDIVRLKN